MSVLLSGASGHYHSIPRVKESSVSRWCPFFFGLVSVTLTLGALLPAAVAAQPACTITGTSGSETLHGTADDDVICAGGGGDFVQGQAGQDSIYGGGGSDDLRGGHDGDLIVGGRGLDSILGGFGDDVLRGGPGRDSLNSVDSASGNDVVNGGPGRDVCRVDEGDTVKKCEHVISS
jgi:hypothetical protein